MALLDGYKRYTRRQRRRAARAHQRLDIQGLRMVAVLTVFTFHLWGWPRGGFIGVDVFFVISGFLITGNLLRMAESRGNVSFKQFYWNRVRRIVPAATAVLILTYLAALLIFLPFRAHQVGIDAFFAFIFMSNWWFAAQETNYFAAGDAVSPIQHFWSLSIEEQFYFIWPALIFLVGLVIARRAWTHTRRMGIAAAVMACVVASSLGWSLYETAVWPAMAYFNTLARVWELGVGALLATAVGLLARIPSAVKPWLSWAGLGLITAGLFLITEGAAGFPAPWALLPVTGAALVIGAGVGGEPAQRFLHNPVSVYVGNISYSLYLVHWPIIVILGALIPVSPYFYIMAVALTFALAIGSYHFVENPLRHSDWGKARSIFQDIRRRNFQPLPSSKYAALGVLTLLALALSAYSIRPIGMSTEIPGSTVALPRDAPPERTDAQLGPLASELRQEIMTALAATQWPKLEPSVESGLREIYPREFNICAGITPPQNGECTWGQSSAPIRMVVVGDSVAIHYAYMLSLLASNSGGQIQVHVEAMAGCMFTTEEFAYIEDQERVAACPARKQHAIDYINANKPTVVVISNNYGGFEIDDDRQMSSDASFESGLQVVDKFRKNTPTVVWLAAPPGDKNIKECYGTRSSVPADCISSVSNRWLATAATERRLAEAVGGLWVDSRPWFCSQDGRCPSFVGSTPTKQDSVHPTKAYEEKIYPVVGESFRQVGLL